MSHAAAVRRAVADGVDGRRIDRLAAMAAAAHPKEPCCSSEVRGDQAAAIGIFDRSTIADPDRSTLALWMRLHLLRFGLRLIVSVHGL